VWKEVIPITDELVKGKIHQTYRIKYLKDSVLLGALDDSTFTTINTLVFYNHCEIISSLQADDEFLAQM
jgi:protein phosphatase 4 regulatory subunit 3